MKLIVGLGNPGLRYRGTRHNMGFQVVTALAKEHRLTLKRDARCGSLGATLRLAGEAAGLALPLSYMNLSGQVVRKLVVRHRVDTAELLVVCDDLNLEFGRLKIRPAGSAGGHKGLESIIEALGTDRFCRLRIGIGAPPAGSDAAEYVLRQFTRQQARQLPQVIERAIACVHLWVGSGVAESMNVFNNFLKETA